MKNSFAGEITPKLLRAGGLILSFAALACVLSWCVWTATLGRCRLKAGSVVGRWMSQICGTSKDADLATTN